MISTMTNVSKRAFIRSFPASMPVKEVVSKARAKGISISDAYVYWTRRQAKEKAAKAAARRAATAGNGAELLGPITITSSSEDRLTARSR
jgi:hypothetical protein